MVVLLPLELEGSSGVYAASLVIVTDLVMRTWWALHRPTNRPSRTSTDI